MSRIGKKKSAGDGQNLVTILFVLGVVGWGFFAIDRLTDGERSQSRSRVQGRVAAQDGGWKKSVRDWLNKKLTSESGGKNADESHSVSRNIPEGEIPLLPEPRGLQRDNNSEVIREGEPVEASAEQAEGVFLFYRLNSKGQPVLSRVKHKLAEDNGNLRSLVAELVKGPSGAELDRDFIDSFIRKPRILGAEMKGKCAVVDFDANFGAGVSYQTLRFQVQQLFRNLQLWKGAECLELRVRGQYTPHLGSDGLFFPRRIDAHWLAQNS